MKYIIAAIKGLLVGASFIVIGNFIIDKVLYLQVDWPHTIIYILGILLGRYAINYFDSPAIKRQENTIDASDKVVVIAMLPISLVIMFFPEIYGFTKSWVNALFMGIGLLLMMLAAWWVERRQRQK